MILFTANFSPPIIRQLGSFLENQQSYLDAILELVQETVTPDTPQSKIDKLSQNYKKFLIIKLKTQAKVEALQTVNRTYQQKLDQADPEIPTLVSCYENQYKDEEVEVEGTAEWTDLKRKIFEGTSSDPNEMFEGDEDEDLVVVSQVQSFVCPLSVRYSCF